MDSYENIYQTIYYIILFRSTPDLGMDFNRIRPSRKRRESIQIQEIKADPNKILPNFDMIKFTYCFLPTEKSI